LIIKPVVAGPAFDQFRVLFAEYAAMPHNLGRAKDPDGEFTRLPEPYVAPEGLMLLATLADAPVGCVVLVGLEPPHICEMKRLYVRDAGRGQGVGKALVEEVMRGAVDLGYLTMRLDTAPELNVARTMYASMGFREIASYHDRYDDAICFEIALNPPAS
jgi:putative acetyltransferase